MKEKIYQVNERNIKSIFFGKKELIFSKEKIEVSVKFTELHKYPRLIEKTVKIRFDEIKKITFDKNEIKVKAYVKMESLNFNENFTLSENDLTSFKNQIEELQYKKNIIRRNKFQRISNHHGIFAVFTGIIFTYLTATGANFSNTQGKTKIYGYIIQKTIDTLGPTVSIIISIVILIYGVYSIWRTISKPDDENSTKISYSNLKIQ